MLRRLSIFAFVFAALLLAEPLLHNHPLQPVGTSAAAGVTCAICASGVQRLPMPAPSVAAPQIIVDILPTIAVTIVTVIFALPLTSRAPPAL